MGIRLVYTLIDETNEHEFASGSVRLHPDSREPVMVLENYTYLWSQYIAPKHPSDLAVLRSIEVKADFRRADSWTQLRNNGQEEAQR